MNTLFNIKQIVPELAKEMYFQSSVHYSLFPCKKQICARHEALSGTITSTCVGGNGQLQKGK